VAGATISPRTGVVRAASRVLSPPAASADGDVTAQLHEEARAAEARAAELRARAEQTRAADGSR